MPRLNENLIIAIDDNGNSFKVVTLPEHEDAKLHFLGPECVNPCGYDLKRSASDLRMLWMTSCEGRKERACGALHRILPYHPAQPIVSEAEGLAAEEVAQHC
jgi:hypothetical protein